MNPEDGLFCRVVKGGFWLFGLGIAQEIVALARLVVLARLLSPDDFGLAGIAILVLATIETLTQTGFDSALIQKKEEISGYLDTAWTIGVLRGIAVFIVLYLVAPYGAAFFGTPGATALIRVIALTVLARSFTSIGVVQFRRDIRFDKQFVWQFTGRLADLAVAVVAALVFESALALVLALLAGDVARLVASYALDPYRPHLRIDWAKARELFSFGKWLLGLGIVAFLLTQGDNALVAKLVGTTLLGFYQLARRVSNVPATEIAHVISAVTFPAYSKIQDNIPKLREAYLMVLEVTALAAMPVAGFILVLAPDITALFFGAKWLPAVPAMQILAIWGALGAIAATTDPALIAVGRPRKLTKYQAIQLVTLAAIIYPATVRWSITGTSLAVLLASILPCYLALRKVAAVTACGAGAITRTVLVPLAASGLAAGAAWGARRWISPANVSLPGFVAAILLYSAIYVGVVWRLGRCFQYDAGRTLRQVLRALPIGRGSRRT